MQEYFAAGGADGFNIMPTGLSDFVDLVTPDLHRRGHFLGEYDGATLQENLGLSRPENRLARTRAAFAAE